MPWTCCGDDLSDDLLRCPKCSAGKANWTVRFDKTRAFRVGRKRGATIDVDSNFEEGPAIETGTDCEEPPSLGVEVLVE